MKGFLVPSRLRKPPIADIPVDMQLLAYTLADTLTMLNNSASALRSEAHCLCNSSSRNGDSCEAANR